MSTERRYKIAYLPESRVFGLFLNALPASCPTFCLPRLTGVPEDVKVVSVHHDWQRSAFGFLLEHESFNSTPDCCAPPEVQVDFISIHFPVPGSEEVL